MGDHTAPAGGPSASQDPASTGENSSSEDPASAGETSPSKDPASAGDAFASVYGIWFNPEDGTVSEIFRPEMTNRRLSIANTRSGGGDQILILACSPDALHFVSGCYGEGESIQDTQKVFEW